MQQQTSVILHEQNEIRSKSEFRNKSSSHTVTRILDTLLEFMSWPYQPKYGHFSNIKTSSRQAQLKFFSQ